MYNTNISNFFIYFLIQTSHYHFSFNFTYFLNVHVKLSKCLYFETVRVVYMLVLCFSSIEKCCYFLPEKQYCSTWSSKLYQDRFGLMQNIRKLHEKIWSRNHICSDNLDEKKIDVWDLHHTIVFRFPLHIRSLYYSFRPKIYVFLYFDTVFDILLLPTIKVKYFK